MSESQADVALRAEAADSMFRMIISGFIHTVDAELGSVGADTALAEMGQIKQAFSQEIEAQIAGAVLESKRRMVISEAVSAAVLVAECWDIGESIARRWLAERKNARPS